MPFRRPSFTLRDVVVGALAALLVLVIVITAVLSRTGEDAEADQVTVAQSFADANQLYESLRGSPRPPLAEECGRLRGHWEVARSGLASAPSPAEAAADSVEAGLADTTLIAVPDSAELATRLRLIAAYLRESCDR